MRSRVALAEPVDRGFLVAEGFEELERELGSVERMLREVRDGIGDLNGVHGSSLLRVFYNSMHCGLSPVS